MRMLGKGCTVAGQSQKMYPDDVMVAFYADEVADACMDVQKQMAKTFALEGEERKAARQNMFKEGGLCTNITSLLEARVKAIGGAFKFTCADYLTIGDVWLFTWLNTLRCGFLDDVDKNYLDAYPTLKAKVAAVAAHPAVAAYYRDQSGFYECFKA